VESFWSKAGLELRDCKPLGISATLKSGFRMEVPADTRRAVSKPICFFALTFGVLLFVRSTSAAALYPNATVAQIAPILDQPSQPLPIMNRIAHKVVQKYQNSTCEQLWQKSGHGPFRLIARAMNRKPKDESAAGIDYPIAPRIPDPSKADPDDPT
jgi:hypothetical protein